MEGPVRASQGWHLNSDQDGVLVPVATITKLHKPGTLKWQKLWKRHRLSWNITVMGNWTFQNGSVSRAPIPRDSSWLLVLAINPGILDFQLLGSAFIITWVSLPVYIRPSFMDTFILDHKAHTAVRPILTSSSAMTLFQISLLRTWNQNFAYLFWGHNSTHNRWLELTTDDKWPEGLMKYLSRRRRVILGIEKQDDITSTVTLLFGLSMCDDFLLTAHQSY